MKKSKNILFLIFAMTILSHVDSFSQSTENVTNTNYEFRIVHVGGLRINVFDNSGQIETVEINKGEKPEGPIIKKLETLSSQGWEIISVQEGTYGSQRYLLQRQK